MQFRGPPAGVCVVVYCVTSAGERFRGCSERVGGSVARGGGEKAAGDVLLVGPKGTWKWCKV